MELTNVIDKPNEKLFLIGSDTLQLQIENEFEEAFIDLSKEEATALVVKINEWLAE